MNPRDANGPIDVSHIFGGDPLEAVDIDDLEGIQKAVDELIIHYDIQVLSPFREGKKLLILDLDCTLTFSNGSPRLDDRNRTEMLVKIYDKYDIILWSTMSREDMARKLETLKLRSSREYAFAFYLDGNATVSTSSRQFHRIQLKPLAFIWRKFPQFSAKNTIVFDDNWRNYAANKRSGMSTQRTQGVDADSNLNPNLANIVQYLEYISGLPSLLLFDHNQWEVNKERWDISNVTSFEGGIMMFHFLFLLLLDSPIHIL